MLPICDSPSSLQKRSLQAGESSASKRRSSLQDVVQVQDSTQPSEAQEAENLARVVNNSYRRTSENEVQPQDRIFFSEAAKFGFLALVDTVFDFEESRGHSFASKFELSTWRRAGLPFLAAIPNKLLECIMEGTLAKDWVDGDDELTDLFGKWGVKTPEDERVDMSSEISSSSEELTWWMENASHIAPGHYIRVLVNEAGHPPTPSELLKIIDALRRYTKPAPYDSEFALKIDNVKRSGRSSEKDVKLGKNYFLCAKKSSDKRVRNGDRVTITRQFCDALKRRLDRVDPSELDRPDVRPLSYVGYASSVSKRMTEHEGDGTSFLMQLLDQICQVLEFPYHFETFVTSFATNANKAKFGEIFINALAQSYHDTSFGVSVHPAGENCSSVEFVGGDHDLVQLMWKDTIAFRFRCTPFEANMDREIAMRQDKTKFAGTFEQKRREKIDELRAKLTAPNPRVENIRKLWRDARPHPDTPVELRGELEATYRRTGEFLKNWDARVDEIRTLGRKSS